MDGDAATAAIAVLVRNLISISAEEISLIRGLEKETENLKETLCMIQNSLDDARKKFITEESVRRWLKELEDVAFDADNALDELNYQLVSKKMKSVRNDTKKKKKKVASCFSPISFNQYVSRRQMALTIKEINTRFERIDQRATKLGLGKSLADADAGAGADETDSFALDSVFIGRDDVVLEIVAILTDPTDQKALSVLPIVGMGGLGKTTLVRNVFNHEKIEAHFGQQIWVHVSQDFDEVVLLKKILSNLKGEKVEYETKEVILKKLREALGDKAFLLVLDDVWNQDRRKWEGFINSLSGIASAEGNGVLVTTRNTEVGSIVNTIGIHHLNGLSEEECWSVIKDKAFKGRGEIPVGVEAIGRSIAGRCQGLPLAANVVGGVLRDKSQDEWRSIEENWLSDVGEDVNSISRILRLSYDHLSSPSLKKCFAYCSIFSKGTQIESNYLVELWMAEGFLQSSPISDMEDIGNKFIDLLVQSSLLQVAKRDEYNNIMECSMHDLVHDVAASVLGFPKVNDNTSDGLYQSRHVLWESRGIEPSPIAKEQKNKLRTYFFYGGEIRDIIFSDFRSLHVLTLGGYYTQVLPDSIGDLIHLRLLDVSETRIQNLPDSIGELYHLQTCRANASELWGLPSTFKYLLNLRHLYKRDFTSLPPQFGMLTSLRTLQYFKVHAKEGLQIEELANLQNLKGKLEIDGLESVLGEDESNRACLFQKSGILKLVLRWYRFREGGTNDENVLKGLQPPPNLKILEISGYKGASFPSWTLKMEGLDNLMEIKLEFCEECEEIPALGHLPCLKFVCFSKLKNVKYISCSFYNIGNCSSNNVFPALEKLKLLDMPNLTEWMDVEIPSGAQVKVFPRLEYLEIRRCNQLSNAPTTFPRLKVLKIEEMNSGIPLANICTMSLTSLVELEIFRVREMEYIPHWIFHNNQNLSSLFIKFCNKLRELPDGLENLGSLEKLTISCCENLKSIPFSSPSGRGLTSLRSLSIGTYDTTINVPREMVESCASSLEELVFAGTVTGMEMAIEHMHKMRRLALLNMEYVNKVIISSTTEHQLGYLRNLKTLSFGACNSWDCESFNKCVGGILRLGSRSLRTLILRGKDDWECLPDQLQHLTSLSELRLYNFGIEELPEWFGNLSSLEELKLYDCVKLKREPFAQVMRRLTNLTNLECSDSPLLGGLSHHLR